MPTPDTPHTSIADPGGSSASSHRGALLVCLITAFLTPFLSSALNLSVTDISTEFNCGATTVTWVISVFTLTLAAFSVPFGHLADLTDHRRLLIAGVALSGIASLLCACATGIAWLIITRVVLGVGSAMVYSANIPLLLSHFPPSRRGQMLGYSITSTYVGLSLGPVLGGALNSALGWRSIFILVFVVTVAVFFIARRYVRPEEARVRGQQDVGGNILYVVMIVSLMLGLSCWSYGWWSKVLAAVSLPLFYLFVRQELRSDHPVIQVRLFASDRAYTLSNLAALLNYGATFVISYCLSIYLQNVQGFNSGLAGLILISQPLVMSCLSAIAGRLSDTVAPYKLASGGMFLTSVGLFCLSRLQADTPLWQLILVLVLIGLGAAFFSSPNNNAVLSCVDRQHYGEANSILATMRTLGHSSSMVMVMMVFGFILGDVVISAADPLSLTRAIKMTFTISCLICLAGTGISLVRGRK